MLISFIFPLSGRGGRFRVVRYGIKGLGVVSGMKNRHFKEKLTVIWCLFLRKIPRIYTISQKISIKMFILGQAMFLIVEHYLTKNSA